jgi:dGTPase
VKSFPDSSKSQEIPFSLDLSAVEGRLAPYAARSGQAVRERPEENCPYRTAYQRDRDRVLHCRPFRRLAHKTQVFIATLGDHHRTRLTHTLEVSQIARTLARCFQVNEDLTEAIALGHDLGHTPFGHAGERALASLHPGGFNHQTHSLRIVEKLADGVGLNLTRAVRNGIVNHSKGRGPIFVRGPASPQTVEGQLVRVADIIAYLAHDLDDASRAFLVDPQHMPPDLYKTFGPRASTRIQVMVADLLANSRTLGRDLVLGFSEAMEKAMENLRTYLHEKVYTHPLLLMELKKGDETIRFIYEHLLTDDSLLGFLDLSQGERSQAACDFIAGMTDRYAINFGEKLRVGQIAAFAALPGTSQPELSACHF